MKLQKTYIIAEAGVNHNGDINLAKKMIDSAADSGADAIKFQTFKASSLLTKQAEKADYQKQSTSDYESQFDMITRLELSLEAYRSLYEKCIRRKIEFLSSPFDIESIRFLASLGIKLFKVPSGEITNLPYLEEMGRLGQRVILSTGMSSLPEIKSALDTLTSSGTLFSDIVVLHTNSEYPSPFRDINLKAMDTIKNEFSCKIGFSDHSMGIEAPIAAVALGASVIEKHFTLDRSLPGPDHEASLEPTELAAMIIGIRNIELALGDGIKRPSKSELKNIEVVRKSIVAATSIMKGETFSTENLSCKRPGKGISPMKWYDLIGNKAMKDYSPDDLIEISEL